MRTPLIALLLLCMIAPLAHAQEGRTGQPGKIWRAPVKEAPEETRLEGTVPEAPPPPADIVTAPSPFSRYAIQLGVGTTGPRLDLTTNLTGWLNVRLGASWIPGDQIGPLERTVQFENMALDVAGEAEYAQGALLLDFVPASWLRFTAGAAYARRVVAVVASPTSDLQVGQITIPKDRMGALHMDLTLADGVLPYAGVSLGNALARTRRASLGFFLEVGAYLNRSPDVRLSPSDPSAIFAPTANGDNEAALTGLFEEYPLYPEVALGLTFRF